MWENILICQETYTELFLNEITMSATYFQMAQPEKVYVYIYMCVCVCVYIYTREREIYSKIYIYVYIYIYIQRERERESCMSCLHYLLEINTLSVASFANVFSHSEGYLLISFMVSFAMSKLLSSLGPICLFLFLFSLFQEVG